MSSPKITLIYADETGKLYEDPELSALGLNGRQVEVAGNLWLNLPAGGELVALPGRLPTGYNQNTGEVEVVESYGGKRVTAVAGILPVGYTRKLIPVYEIASESPTNSLKLPLFGYTAIGAVGGVLKVAALKTDTDLKWNPVYYNTPDLARLVARKRKKFPDNRLMEQLGRCALEYHCLTAQNIFYERWEAGIPVSPGCNANCLGCISLQAAECCPAPQERIQFVPALEEIVELAVPHLETAPEGIISFGQGCEGEPSLECELLVDSLRVIRERTAGGTINLNTNAGDYQAIQRLTDAGLDHIRISLFSARPEQYHWYHRPHGYTLEDVGRSAKYTVTNGVKTALNLLFFPGFTNQRAETEAFYEFLAATGVQQVQLRNLNLDPDQLAEKMTDEALPAVDEWLAALKGKFPELSIGNYTQPK